jgi:diacylglycerol kinase (ATP)
MNRVRVIFNPTAAGGRGAQLGPEIQDCLQNKAKGAKVELEWMATEAPGHALALAEKAAADGCDMVVSIGGDGTTNEVVNGLMRAGTNSTRLGIIPAGSGNDFAWFAGIALDPLAACQRLFDGETRVIDIGYIRDGNGRERYFNNGCGAGFDATVALEVEKYKWLRGILVYLVPLLKTVIFHHENPTIRISVDEREWTQSSMMITIGNGRRLGKGFLVTPEARLDDGQLDVCICGHLGRLGILRVIPRFMRGTHVTHPQVQMELAQRVKVESPVPLNVHIDGESFATDVRQFEVSVVPRALQIKV